MLAPGSDRVRLLAGNGKPLAGALPRCRAVLLALVRAGLGIALIPRLGRAPLGDDLAAVPVADPVPSREIVALHRGSMSDSPAIAALLTALTSYSRAAAAAIVA